MPKKTLKINPDSINSASFVKQLHVTASEMRKKAEKETFLPRQKMMLLYAKRAQELEDSGLFPKDDQLDSWDWEAHTNKDEQDHND